MTLEKKKSFPQITIQPTFIVEGKIRLGQCDIC